MIEPRIYRAAFVPALLALLVAMFSLEDRPPAVPQGLAADVLFDGRFAESAARRLVSEHPDRRPGTRGDQETAETVAATLAERGFEVAQDRFEAEGRRLVNVVARQPGRSQRQVVVLAARDAADVPDATTSAADTATLLELGRALEGRVPHKSVILASVDGETLGSAGSRRLAERLGDPRGIDGVIVVSNMGAPRARGSVLVPWSTGSTRENLGLERTAAESLRQELGTYPGREGTLGQLVRLGYPLGLGSQGPLEAAGYDAVRLSGSGELPPPEGGVADVDRDRYGSLGRAALRTVSAIDADGTPEHGPGSYLVLAGRVMPGWALSLLAFTLLLPALVAAADALARARRRRESPGGWVAWCLAGALPFAFALLAARVLDLVGVVDAPPSAVPPDQLPISGAGGAALGATVVAGGLGWALGRRAVLHYLAPRESPSAPGSAAALAGVLSLAVLAVWALNPVAALLLAPALHLWIAATAADMRPGAAVLLAAGGLVLPLGAALFYLDRLSLDPLGGIWYGFGLLAGGHIHLPAALLGCAVLGCLVGVIAILAARAAEADHGPPKATVRGPGGHAGPGSLGAVDSALRR